MDYYFFFKTNYKRFIQLSLIASLGVIQQLTAKEALNKPNIVFIFTDDHAVQSIGAYGSKINKTPNIDRLAKSGVLFENSFCQNSICGPSRATVLTGKMSHKNGFYYNVGGTKFDGSQVTFPKLLQASGYKTALIGKWHLKSKPTGFNYWEILPGQGNYYNPDFYSNTNKKRQIQGHSTEVITDLSLAWLDKQNKNQPFLLMCQYKAPHRTWAPNTKYLNLYKDENLPVPDTLFDDYSNRSKVLKGNAMSIDKHFYYSYDLQVKDLVPFASEREIQLKQNEYPRMNAEQKAQWDKHFEKENRDFLANPPTGKDLVIWKYQRYVKNYLRCIAGVDDGVGRILDYLEKNNLMENTIIVYSSDQGFYLGEHGWYDKRWMFEESLRMPLIMSWKGVIKPNQKVTKMVQNIDYAPTLLAAAGIQVPKDIQGESFLKLLKLKDHVKSTWLNFFKKISPWRKSIYYHYYEHLTEHKVPKHEGVRTNRYKLIHFYDTQEFNLFDLKKDPKELINVAGNSEYKSVLLKMKKELKKLRAKYNLPPLSKK